MSLTKGDAEAEAVFSDRFLSKMDRWLRSLDPASEFVFRAAMRRQSDRVRADERFVRRYAELRARLKPSAAERRVILKRAKRVQSKLDALLPGT